MKTQRHRRRFALPEKKKDRAERGPFLIISSILPNRENSDAWDRDLFFAPASGVEQAFEICPSFVPGEAVKDFILSEGYSPLSDGRMAEFVEGEIRLLKAAYRLSRAQFREAIG